MVEIGGGGGADLGGADYGGADMVVGMVQVVVAVDVIIGVSGSDDHL